MRFITFIITIHFAFFLSYGSEETTNTSDSGEEIVHGDTLQKSSEQIIESKESEPESEDIPEASDTKEEILPADTPKEEQGQIEQSDKQKPESEEVVKEETIKVSDIKEQIIHADTLYDEFGRLSSFKRYSLKYDKNSNKQKRVPLDMKLYSYEDDIYKKLGGLHIAIGSLALAGGITEFITWIKYKTAPLIVVSSISLITASIEIGIGGVCLKHRKKFAYLHKEYHEETQKIPLSPSGIQSRPRY